MKQKYKEFDPKSANKEHDSRLDKKRSERQTTRQYNNQKMTEFFNSNGSMTVNK